MLVVAGSELRELLTMEDCIAALESAHAEFSRRETVLPVRSYMMLPELNGRMAIMPGLLSRSQAMGIKVQCTFHDNVKRGLPTVSGLVIVHDAETGIPLAAMDSGYVTAVRTAAASALATKYLSRPESGSLAILGAGVQGRTHVWAMKTVRSISSVRVWSRQRETAERFKEDIERAHEVSVEVFDGAHDAVVGADIVCTTSLATTPILRGAWLTAGTHVNAVGSHAPDTRELDGEALERARVVVDSLDAVGKECGDVLLAVEEGRLSISALVGEIGEVIEGTKQGRLEPSDITIYKSLGIALQDVATAMMIYRKALERRIGTEVDMAVEGPAFAPIRPTTDT